MTHYMNVSLVGRLVDNLRYRLQPG